MKKGIILIIAVVYSFLGVNICFAAADTWTQKADFGGTARAGAVGFSIGTKGYIGTGNNSSGGTSDFWEYDPVANTWTQKADLAGGVRGGAVGFSIGTKGYIGTGTNSPIRKDFWEYDPAANTWTQKADFGGGLRTYAVGFSIGTKGYIGTGQSPGASHLSFYLYRDFWEYDPAANTWTQKANFGGAARDNAVGFSIGTKGYIGTGWNETLSMADFWEYDSAANTWTRKANFGGGTTFVSVAFSIGSQGYLGTPSLGFWEYDPAADTWTRKADFGGDRRQAAVGFSIGTKGYIGTGLDGSALYKDFWEYEPSTTAKIQVTPSALDFGMVREGTGEELTLTVKNTGIGTLAGNATTVAPFSIVSGGGYNLGADQSQVVTIQYLPTSPGTHTGEVVFTGGNGAIISVTGKTPTGFTWLPLILGN